MPEYKLRDKFDRTSELIYYTKSFLVVVIGWQRYDIFLKNPNRNATFSFGCKDSSLGERRAARGGSTRPDERNRRS